ncbi:MAG: chemotaxis response regulator protein-glutamate methylesterase [Pseudomonadales bacterium]
MKKIKVLIVDDSQAMCRFLEQILSADAEIEVVGSALDAFEARSLIKQLNPDVLTLDIEMPRMDGLTFLKNLMRLRPMPVVMLSSLTASGAAVTLEALSAGALDFLVKRHPVNGDDYIVYIQEIVQRVKVAAQQGIQEQSGVPKRVGSSDHAGYGEWSKQVVEQPVLSKDIDHVVAIGASTGGPEAIRAVLQNFYAPRVALVLSQHMPDKFMEPFARRLDSVSQFSVTVAQSGAKLQPGCCYVAPGNQHMKFTGRGAALTMTVSDGDKVNGHRPAVDVMFKSLAQRAGASCLGVLLTGMGRDGAEGMRDLAQAGSFNLIQDEKSSAVWGMPGAAAGLGAAHATLSLTDIGPTLESLLTGAQPARSKVS